MPNSAQAKEHSRSQTFGAVLPDFMIEAVVDQSHATQLRLHTWDGRRAATTPTVSFRGCTYTAAPVAAGLSRAVRFPRSSKAFGTAAQFHFLDAEVSGRLRQPAAGCGGVDGRVRSGELVWGIRPVAPILYLLGPDNEATLLLRLFGMFLSSPYFVERRRHRGPWYFTPKSGSDAARQPARSRTARDSSVTGVK